MHCLKDMIIIRCVLSTRKHLEADLLIPERPGLVTDCFTIDPSHLSLVLIENNEWIKSTNYKVKNVICTAIFQAKV